MDLNKSIICPKCGSKNIYIYKKGFSTGKAIAGGLLTGNIFVAAAAGGIGANKIVLTCLDCGHNIWGIPMIWKKMKETQSNLPNK